MAPSISYFLQYNSKVQAIESHMEKTKEALKNLRENLQMAQNMMKKKVDRCWSEKTIWEEWLGISRVTILQEIYTQAKEESKIRSIILRVVQDYSHYWTSDIWVRFSFFSHSWRTPRIRWSRKVDSWNVRGYGSMFVISSK